MGLGKQSIRIVKNLLKTAFEKERYGLIADANARLKRVRDMPSGHQEALNRAKFLDKAPAPHPSMFN